MPVPRLLDRRLNELVVVPPGTAEGLIGGHGRRFQSEHPTGMISTEGVQLTPDIVEIVIVVLIEQKPYNLPFLSARLRGAHVGRAQEIHQTSRSGRAGHHGCGRYGRSLCCYRKDKGNNQQMNKFLRMGHGGESASDCFAERWSGAFFSLLCHDLEAVVRTFRAPCNPLRFSFIVSIAR